MIPEMVSSEALTMLIREPTVKIYQEGGNLNDLRTEYNLSQIDDSSEKMSIIQASCAPEGISFRVLKSHILNRNISSATIGDQPKNKNSSP